jgi:acyl carrier protein
MRKEEVEMTDEQRKVLARDLTHLINGLVQGDACFEDQDSFLEKSNMSSLQVVEFAVSLEKRFGITFGEDPEDFEAMLMFGSLVDLVGRKAKL